MGIEPKTVYLQSLCNVINGRYIDLALFENEYLMFSIVFVFQHCLFTSLLPCFGPNQYKGIC